MPTICQELQEISLQNLVLRYSFYDKAFETDMIFIYYFEMCPNTLTHMLNEIQIHATLLQDILFKKL